MHEDEGPTSQGPAEEHKDFEKARVGKLQPRHVGDKVNAEQRIDHYLDGEWDELQRLERFVRKRVPANLGEGAVVLEDGHVSAEIEVGEKERERKGQGQRKPAAHEVDVKSKAHPSETEDADDHQRVN